MVELPAGENNLNSSLTVIIPVRNEGTTIGLLLDDLCRQEQQPVEILVIDDHSEDNTRAVVEAVQRYCKIVRLLELRGAEGKKKAIELGVQQAAGSVIVTVDGDCRVGVRWLSSIQRWFTDDAVKFVFGGVRISQDMSFGADVQAIEFSSLVGTGAATIGYGLPSVCNGANMAFRKDVFQEVHGYQDNHHIPSGDDEFLMRKVTTHYPRGVRFNNQPEGSVSTGAIKNFFGFLSQRIRWAGKWKHHRNPGNKLLPVVIFLIHFFILVTAVWIGFTGEWKWIAAGFLAKSLAELIFLRGIIQFLGGTWNWKAFILLELVYSFYAVSFGILANSRSFEWKGRKLEHAAAKI